jgi:hypothetical protein
MSKPYNRVQAGNMREGRRPVGHALGLSAAVCGRQLSTFAYNRHQLLMWAEEGGKRHDCTLSHCIFVYKLAALRYIRCGLQVGIMATDDSPPFHILYPHWQNEYAAALLETNPQKLFERVEAAEAAIFNRLQHLSQDFDSFTERQVIEDALQSLRVLKRDELTFPDWEKK